MQNYGVLVTIISINMVCIFSEVLFVFFLDNCKKFGLVFDNVVGIVEVINSKDIQMQVSDPLTHTQPSLWFAQVILSACKGPFVSSWKTPPFPARPSSVSSPPKPSLTAQCSFVFFSLLEHFLFCTPNTGLPSLFHEQLINLYRPDLHMLGVQ